MPNVCQKAPTAHRMNPRALILLLVALHVTTIMAQGQTPDTPKTPVDRAAATAEGNAISSLNTGSENVSMDESGDAIITMPFLTIESRSMQIPLPLMYQPGIKVDDRSGPVGLGWKFSIGSIVRDYGAYEPDYSTICYETTMKRQQGNGSEYFEENLAGNAQQFYNNKKLAYDGLPSTEVTGPDPYLNGQFTPDKYHVSLPGGKTGSFWNQNGPPAQTHQFVFQSGEPWRVQKTTQTFDFPQETSRINEYNLTYPIQNNQLEHGSSIATAIGFYPYVKEADNDIMVNNTGPIGNGNIVTPSNITYEDFNQFTVTTDDGTRYVYGRALRGQKYLFSEDPFWSTVNSYPSDPYSTPSPMIKGEFWKTEYIAEWLVTQILSYDYVDVNNNGQPDDGDSGDWILIEYTEPLKIENRFNGTLQNSVSVPRYREWSQLSQTDQASSLMRELAYVTRIVTPIREYRFEISKRMEVDHDFFTKPTNYVGTYDRVYEDLYVDSDEDPSSFDVNYPVETMKYDKVTSFDRTRDLGIYTTEGSAIGTVTLRYARPGSAEELAVSKYLIRTNDNVEFNLSGPNDHFSPTLGDQPQVGAPNQFNIEAFNVQVINDQKQTHLQGRGKTTLLGIDFRYGDGSSDVDIQSYNFQYGFNPSFDNIHKRRIIQKRFFPLVRQSGRNQLWSSTMSPIRNFTQVGSVNHPWEFLFEAPSRAYNFKLEYSSAVSLLSTGNDGNSFDFVTEAYINNANPSAQILNMGQTSWDDPTLYTGLHPLEPIMDEFGYYYGTGDPDIDRKAWTLTKVTLPTGGSIALEYESDRYNGDQQNWSFTEDEIPLIKDYNRLSKRLAIVQNAINDVLTPNSSWPQVPGKQAPATFGMSMDPTYAGGLRVKEKTIDPGVGPAIVYRYEYGDGHYTEIPQDYVQSCFGEFSNMVRWETLRNARENDHYSFQINDNLPWFTNGYNESLSRLGHNIRFESWDSGHHYEWIREIHPGSGERVKFYGDGLASAPADVPLHLIQVKRTPTLTPKDDVYILQPSGRVLHGPKLLSEVEKDEAGLEVQRNEMSYTWSGDIHTVGLSSRSDQNIPLYNNYQLYVLMLEDHTYPINMSIAQYDNGGGSTSINTFANTGNWQTMSSGQPNPPAYFMLWATMYHGDASIASLPTGFSRFTSYRVNVSQQRNIRLGLESLNEYTYDQQTGLRRTQKTTNSESVIGGSAIIEAVITHDLYAFEEPEYSSFLMARNILVPVSRTTAYANSISPSNVLKATMNTWNWDVEDATPRQDASFVFNSTTGADGRALNFEPYVIAATNPKWDPRGSVLEFGMSGLPRLTRTTSSYQRVNYGYNGGLSNAWFDWDSEWFDAAYTGFEDVRTPNIIAPLARIDAQEEWAEVNNDPQPIPSSTRNLSTAHVASVDAPSGWMNSWGSNTSVFAFLRFDNSDNVYAVGDRVKVRMRFTYGPSECNCNNASFPNQCDDIVEAQPSYIVEFERTIDDITAAPASAWITSALPMQYNRDGMYLPHMLHFSEPFPAEAMPSAVWWADCHPGEQVPSITRLTTKRSAISRRSRTGEYSYLLAKRPNEEAQAERTPGRFVSLKANTGLSTICLEEAPEVPVRNSDNPECFIPYTVSFYARNGGIGEVGQDFAAFQDPPLPGQLNEQIGAYNVQLVWKVWDAAHQNILEQGVLHLDGLQDGNWRFFETDLLVRRKVQDRDLEVYIRNNIVGSASSSSPQLYIDDLLVRPKGARTSYASLDEFGNTMHATNSNHVAIRSTYDAWGRPHGVYDANEELLETIKHYTTDNIQTRHNYTEVTRYIDQSLAHRERSYSDGLGRPLQMVTTEPARNIRTIQGTTIYDNRGRVATELLPYARVGVQFSGTAEANAQTYANDQYNSLYPFSQLTYFTEPTPRLSSTSAPRENSEAQIVVTSSEQVTTADLTVGNRIYPAGELMVGTTLDPDMRLNEEYTDKFGRRIATHTIIGRDHSRLPLGAIEEAAVGPVHESWTYFTYDLAGNLSTVTDPEGKLSTYRYNSSGALVSSTTPDQGATLLAYDRFGRMRFKKTSTDLAASDDFNIDQFSYVKYDGYDRVVEQGVLRSPAGALAFSSSVALNDPTFPNAPNGLEQHHVLIYDGPTSSFELGQLKEEITYTYSSDLPLSNGDGQSVPNAIDRKVHTYDANGRLRSTSFTMAGLETSPIIENKYNRAGAVTRTTYLDPLVPAHGYSITYSYDELGRVIESSSGLINGSASIDARYRYDAHGRLLRKRLGEVDLANGMWKEVVTMNYNIRGAMAKQYAMNHRYELLSSPGGLFTEQLWNSPYLDGGNLNLNKYEYFYDRSARLTGANFTAITADADPFVTYMNSTRNDKPVFSCTALEPWADIGSAVVQVKALIEAAGEQDMKISDAMADQLMDLLAIMQSELQTAGKSWSELSEEEQELMLQTIFKLAAAKSIDIMAAESLNRELDIILNGQGTTKEQVKDAEIVVDVEKASGGEEAASTVVDENEEVLYGGAEDQQKKDEALELGALHAEDLAFTHLLLKGIDVVLEQRCEINEAALAINTLQRDNATLTSTQGDKYDEAFWYKRNGDMTEKLRFDDVAVEHRITYSYAPNKSWINTLDFLDGGVITNFGMTHDLRGNVTANLHFGITEMRYNAFTNLPTVTRTGACPVCTYREYRYDQQGQRSVQADMQPDGAADYYIGHVIVGENGIPKRYSMAEGFAILGDNGQAVKHYSVTDHLGTPRVTIGPAGVVDARDAHAYGQSMPQRNFVSLDEAARLQFTGHEHDGATQLDYHGARYYDSEIGRYLGLDPLMSDYASWSPYNYVGGNPISKIDPDGRGWWDVAVGGALAVAENMGASPLTMVTLHRVVSQTLTSKADFEKGMHYGDVASLAIGTAMQVDGARNVAVGLSSAGGAGGSVVVTGGASVPVAAPIAVGGLVVAGVGTAEGAYGGYVAENARQNLMAGRGSNNRQPDQGTNSSEHGPAGADHSVIDESGNTTYRLNPKEPKTGWSEVKRTDTQGGTHKNPDGTVTPTPHVHTKGKKGVVPAKEGSDYGPYKGPKP